MEQEQKRKPILGNLRAPKRITVSRRDTLINALRSSTVPGMIAQLTSVMAFIIVLIGIFVSYKMAGQGGYAIGILMVGALVLSVLSIILALLGLKQKHKSRHQMERRALVLSVVVITFLAVVFIRGIVLFLS